MKNAILLFLLFSTNLSYAQSIIDDKDNSSLTVVNTFYDALADIANNPDVNVATDAFFKGIDCILAPEYQSFPDEFDSLEETDDVSGQLYLSRFRRYLEKTPSSFSYTVVGSVSYMGWNKSAGSFVYFFVDKDYSGKSFRDTVLVNSDLNKICGIRNSSGGDAYTSYLRVNDLLEKAARLCADKEYTEAYSTYKTILAIDPENVDANFQLARMTCKGWGCGNLSRQETIKQTRTFLTQTKSSIDTVLNRME